MAERNAAVEGRIVGGLIIAAALGALMLMMHHPTSIDGADDRLLLRDWGNTMVHGGMMACLFALTFAFAIVARRLGEEQLDVRAGGMAFTGGMTAMIVAALINGFVVGGLRVATTDRAAAALQFATLGLLNQTLALLGMALVSMAMALWAIRMVRMDGLTKVAGVLGVAMALLAGWWLAVGEGMFGLYPATYSMIAFATWSLIVATQMIRGKI